MQLRPSFQEFKTLAAGSGLVPVWQVFLFDVDTAVTAYAKLVEPPFGFLLESVVGGEQWARFSFLGTEPSGAWRLQDGVVSWWSSSEGWSEVETDDPLADLDRRLRSRAPADVEGLPRFWGGAVGYFGYDVVRQIERLPNSPPDDLGIPDALLVFTDVVLAIDNLRGRAMAIAVVPVEPGMNGVELRRAYDAAAERDPKSAAAMAKAAAKAREAASKAEASKLEAEQAAKLASEAVDAADAAVQQTTQQLEEAKAACAEGGCEEGTFWRESSAASAFIDAS